VKSGDIAAEVIHDAQRLVNLEIALARKEVRDLVMANAVAAGLVCLGGLLILLALLVAVPSFVVALVPWKWQATVVWIVGYLLLGLGLAFWGRSRFVLKLPTRTLESLKENKEWVLRRMKSTVR
jgi:energy-coupling factor transporter transmembrane protein EcfT